MMMMVRMVVVVVVALFNPSPFQDIYHHQFDGATTNHYLVSVSLIFFDLRLGPVALP